MPASVVAHLLAADGAIPNHPRWPLLVYPAAVTVAGADHHSNAHEALGIYSGEVTVQFGGDAGVKLVARPGDVIVLPAGTGHKKLASNGTLGVVGAYPIGAHPDTCMPPLARAKKNSTTVARVPLPSGDPVFGKSGPLFEHWR